MSKSALELEKPVLEFEKKIEELKELASALQADLSAEIEALEKRLLKERRSIYSKLTPWDKIMMQRETPETMTLGQNYPNPFNPITQIEFGMPAPGHVRLDVYNVKGELVSTLASGTYGAGFHTVEWNAAGMASGIYFYRLMTRTEVMTKKMILLR